MSSTDQWLNPPAGGDSPLRTAVWEFLRPMLSPRLTALHRDTFVFDERELKHLIEIWGADHIMLGTDYPFDMADFNPVEHVVSTGFDASTTAAIVGGNAKKLLGLRAD